MKAAFKKKINYGLENVILECTPIEALTISDALRLYASSEEIHEDDRRIAERMVYQMTVMRGEDE